VGQANRQKCVPVCNEVSCTPPRAKRSGDNVFQRAYWVTYCKDWCAGQVDCRIIGWGILEEWPPRKRVLQKSGLDGRYVTAAEYLDPSSLRE
jgi:hypothetical protein